MTLYQRAVTALAKDPKTDENQWLTLPIHLGLAWCIDQDGRRDEAIKAYRKALLLAWNREIEHKPTIMEQIEWSWDKVRAKQSPLSRPPQQSFIGPGVCF